ncbi:MAG: protoheme IX farnesyltransferase [Anaerolineae bacterium]|nr:protoheme IX farnesyltransferase [Anaerolineae bacterium]
MHEPEESALQARTKPLNQSLAKARALISLTKPLQTLLLLVTGICAYTLSRPGQVLGYELLGGGIALAGSIGGCTALNMVLDRDIDAKMSRTVRRPLPDGRLAVRTATVFGLLLAGSGLILAWLLSPLFGAVVTAGLVIDLVVYTAWLKRRTPLSILWGGISGGMPALAGRALATGRLDVVGVLLAAGVLLWIPAHILTLSTHYAQEYKKAQVPVWPNVFGLTATRRLVAGASILNTVALGAAGWLLHIHPFALWTMTLQGVILSGIAIVALLRPSKKLNWYLFKAASLYMLGAFICLTVGTVI